MSEGLPGEPEESTAPLLDGRYRLNERIGVGGMGVVYRGEHAMIGRPVAIKLLQAHYAEDEQATERFIREAQAAASIDHPNICAATDFGRVESGELFLVMELLEGHNLKTLLQVQPKLSPERAVSIIAQIASALAQAHGHGIVHRDLKPENIFLIERHGEPDFVKVLDFGLARFARGQDGSLTNAGDVMGTPKYMAPEQAAAEKVDHRADLYALGVMAYEMLTGGPPFEAINPIRILIAHMVERPVALIERREALSESFELCQLVERLLAKHPGERPSSARELLEALSHLEVEPGPHAVMTLNATSIAACPEPSVNMVSEDFPDFQAIATMLTQVADRQDASRAKAEAKAEAAATIPDVEPVETPSGAPSNDMVESPLASPLTSIEKVTPVRQMPGDVRSRITRAVLVCGLVFLGIGLLWLLGSAVLWIVGDDGAESTQGSGDAEFTRSLNELRADASIAAALREIEGEDRAAAKAALVALIELAAKRKKEPAMLLLLARGHATAGDDEDAVEVLSQMLEARPDLARTPEAVSTLMLLFSRKSDTLAARARALVTTHAEIPEVARALVDVGLYGEYASARRRAASVLESVGRRAQLEEWIQRGLEVRGISPSHCGKLKRVLPELMALSPEKTRRVLARQYEDMESSCGDERDRECCPALREVIGARLGRDSK